MRSALPVRYVKMEATCTPIASCSAIKAPERLPTPRHERLIPAASHSVAIPCNAQKSARANFFRFIFEPRTQPDMLRKNEQLQQLYQHRLDAVTTLLGQQMSPFQRTIYRDFENLKNKMHQQMIGKKQFKHFEKDLTNLLAAHLPRCGSAGKIKAQAKSLYKKAVVDFINQQEWKMLHRRFHYNNHFYHSRLTPAGQIKLGEKDIFKITYDNKGISSGTSTCKDHATNLWLSEFIASDVDHLQDKDRETVLFKGIRHGILSPYGLRGKHERAAGALHRAREVVTAALFLQPEKLQHALKTGACVNLRLTSTSLVTAFNFGHQTEGKQIAEQLAAWKTLSQEKPCHLEVRDEDGVLKKIRVDLDIVAFNFGVNEAALKFNMGWTQSDTHNLEGLHGLLGDDLTPAGKEGGWVGDYLAQANPPANAQSVKALSLQIRQIWEKKLHRRDHGEPYKLAQRIALLSHAIGVIPCYNCKSGKDRTGMLDSEIKREAVELYSGTPPSIPGVALSAQQKILFHRVLEHSGNLEIQKKNTGAPGNKVLKKISFYFGNLSIRSRIDDADIFSRIKSYSSIVKS